MYGHLLCMVIYHVWSFTRCGHLLCMVIYYVWSFAMYGHFPCMVICHVSHAGLAGKRGFLGASGLFKALITSLNGDDEGA